MSWPWSAIHSSQFPENIDYVQFWYNCLPFAISSPNESLRQHENAMTRNDIPAMLRLRMQRTELEKGSGEPRRTKVRRKVRRGSTAGVGKRDTQRASTGGSAERTRNKEKMISWRAYRLNFIRVKIFGWDFLDIKQRGDNYMGSKLSITDY